MNAKKAGLLAAVVEAGAVWRAPGYAADSEVVKAIEVAQAALALKLAGVDNVLTLQRGFDNGGFDAHRARQTQ